GFELVLVNCVRNVTISEDKLMHENRLDFDEKMSANAEFRRIRLDGATKEFAELADKKRDAATMGDKSGEQAAEGKMDSLGQSILPQTPAGDGLFGRLRGVDKEDRARLPNFNPQSERDNISSNDEEPINS